MPVPPVPGKTVTAATAVCCTPYNNTISSNIFKNISRNAQPENTGDIKRKNTFPISCSLTAINPLTGFSENRKKTHYYKDKKL
jgi:hypothetical protein